MLRFAANLSLLYPEHAFLDRFQAAARDGFEAVEFLFPYEFAPQELAARLRDHGLRQVLFNAPPGDFAAGERGLAALPGREADFRASIVQALRYADVLGCPRVHVMSGITPAGVEPATWRATWVDNLRWAAREAGKQGVNLLLEPLNPRDMPGYVLRRQDEAHALVAEIGASNVQVQMDLYHCQIVEGDLATRVRQWLPTGRVGHLQVAGVPQRHEPDVGEVNFGYVFGVLDEVATACGWEGWIGCEYRPARGSEPGGTTAGLDWLRRWRARDGAGIRR